MSYRIKEIFKTIQGEGVWAGTPSIFVRFVACNMWSGYEKDRERDAKRNDAACPLWCDTDFTKEGSTKHVNAQAVVKAVEEARGTDIQIRHVVFTGGEPLLQLDSELVVLLQAANFRVAVETNGTMHPKSGTYPDWITVSPKQDDEHTIIRRFHEIKFVVPDYTSVVYPDLMVRANDQGAAIWYQPEDGPRFDKACERAIALAMMYGHRVSVQTHKIIGAP